MRFFLSFVFCLIVVPVLRAQTSATGIPYFQQHVHYTLAATFNDDYTAPSIDGTGSLEYTNNSPDTLHELYFHLYWNLFKSGSYGESAPNRDHDPDSKYGRGGIEIEAIGYKWPKSQFVISPHAEIDNTIMRVYLTEPLLPGGLIEVQFDWHGILPNYGIRSTWGWHDNGARNFATAQWYPQVCVYDNHGWHPDQYVGMGEFYTDYGSYDVSLTLPKRFSTVSTTGWLANPSEVLSDAVRSQLDFAKAHPDSIVRVADYSNYHYAAISKDAPTQTWKFHADSVRDFAWCADEAYIWDAVYDNGIMHNALYWENSREFWEKEAAKIELLTIQTNSKFAGQYIYPNIFMCETYEGGMEYPGVVFIGPYTEGERDHDPQNTMMHELGHEWYPMMMGSNETDYGYMDEGFNTFITTFVHEKYFGRWNNSYGAGLGFNDDERTSNYRSAILQQLSGNQEPSKQKADAFYSYRDYADATYPHTSSVFFMLRYTMGDTAFADFMKLYYERWRFKHPYPDDLLNAAEDIERTEGDTNRVRARGDLRWFFNEWFEQTWKLDYATGGLEVKKSVGLEGLTYATTITIKRKERAVMPIDLVFTFEDLTTEQKWIPVDDWLRTVADERTYTFTFSKPATMVEINPSLELLDVNRLNNSSTLPHIDVSLIPKVFGDVKRVDSYAIRLSPFFWPVSGDFKSGFQFGGTILGSYLDRTNRFAYSIRDETKGHDQSPSASFQYHSVVDNISPWTDVDMMIASGNLRAGSNFDIFEDINLSHIFSQPGTTTPRHIINLGFDALIRDTGNEDLLYRWFAGLTSHTESAINVYTFAVQAEGGFGDQSTAYSKLAGTMNDRLDITKDWNAYIRLFGGSMNGSTVQAAEFQLASTNDVDHISDLYGSNFGMGVRDKIRNAAVSGPLVRGYLVDANNEGRVAASGSFEIGNRSLFPLSFLTDIPYAGRFFEMFGLSFFGDAGFVTNDFNGDFHDAIKSDLGVGLRFFGVERHYDRQLGLDLDRMDMQIDFPLYLDKPEAGQSKLGFRVVGIVRQEF